MIVYVIQKNGGNENSPDSLNIMVNYHYHGENKVPRTLDTRLCRASCLQGDEAWQLGGIRLGGRLTIWATVSLASSSGVPLPPIWGGVTSPRTLPGRRLIVALSLPLRLAVGGICRSVVPPPLPTSSPCTRSAHYYSEVIDGNYPFSVTTKYW